MATAHPTKTYGQYCTLAKALDLVGDRWTLLVIRELLVGVETFGEIQRHLPACSPTLLTDRLRLLERSGIAERSGPAYRLTARGREIEPAVIELGRFGLELLGRVDDDLLVPHTLPLAIKTLLRYEALPARSIGILFALDKGMVTLSVRPARAERRAYDRVTVATADSAVHHARVEGSLGSLLRARRGKAPLTADGPRWAIDAARAMFGP